ncbi:hypothetical protein L195_g063797, partial [Trifolium pratense]
MAAGSFCIGILEESPEIMRGPCPRHQRSNFVGESGEDGAIDEAILSSP